MKDRERKWESKRKYEREGGEAREKRRKERGTGKVDKFHWNCGWQWNSKPTRVLSSPFKIPNIFVYLQFELETNRKWEKSIDFNQFDSHGIKWNRIGIGFFGVGQQFEWIKMTYRLLVCRDCIRIEPQIDCIVKLHITLLTKQSNFYHAVDTQQSIP